MEFVFYKTTKFKETPIGEVPKDWKVVRLKNVAKIIMGQSPPSSTYNKKGEGLPFLQGKAEFGFIYPSPVTYCSKPMKVAEANDILISVRAPVGDVNLAPCRVCIGRGLAAIRFNNKVASYLFYFYYLQKVKKILESLGKGSTFKAIVKDDLESLAVPLPSLPEQKAIAHILSTVDEAIQKTNEIIEKTRRLKKGLMQELLTKGIGHKEFKDTEIGRVPKEWDVVKLGDIITYRKGKKPTILFDKKEPNTLPYLTADNLRTGIFTQWAREDSDIIKVDEDDLLLIWDGFYCGDAFIGFKGILSSTMIKIEPKKPNLNKRYLYYFLKTRFKILNSQIAGMYLKHVSKFVFESLKVPLPPLSEQEKIAEILSTVDKRLEIERKRKEKLERVKKALMDLLLTGKVRVRVS